MKGLAEEFKGDFECLGRSKEKYITFSVPIKKESSKCREFTKQFEKLLEEGSKEALEEECDENKTIIYKIKFVHSFRFMSTSLSNLVNNLSNRITENGKCDNCDSYLDYMKIKISGRLIFECFDCKRRYTKEISDESLKDFKKN